MSNLNEVKLIGRLTRDPELRYIPGSGTPVAKFSVAIERDYYKKDGSKDTDFIPVEVMGKTAEFCANYLTKGYLVFVGGSMRIDKYNKDDETRYYPKVSANKVQALAAPRKDSQNMNGYQGQNSQNMNGYQGQYPDFKPSFENVPNNKDFNESFPNEGFNPSFNEFDPSQFQAVDDDEIPF